MDPILILFFSIQGIYYLINIAYFVKNYLQYKKTEFPIYKQFAYQNLFLIILFSVLFYIQYLLFINLK